MSVRFGGRLRGVVCFLHPGFLGPERADGDEQQGEPGELRGHTVAPAPCVRGPDRKEYQHDGEDAARASDY